MALIITPHIKHHPTTMVDCCVVWFGAIGHYLRVQTQDTFLGGYEFDVNF